MASVRSPHGRLRSRGPESTRSSNPPRAQKEDQVMRIGRLTSHHVATRGPPDRHLIEGLEMHQTAAIVCNHDLRIAIRRYRDVVEELRDRAAIAARSSRDHTPSAAEPTLLEPTMIDGAPGSRSTHDRGPIAARSWCDRGKNWRLLDREIRSKSSQN